MNTATPAIREFARRLVALEAARNEPPVASGSEAVRVCEKLRLPRSKLAGVAGFCSLMSRAVAMGMKLTRTADGYVMDFPARPVSPVSTPPGLSDALGVVPTEVVVNSYNYLALLEGPEMLRALAPDMSALAQMDRPGVIVTAQGEGTYDFVSRYFAPAKGIPEHPVTGAAHCMLAPYWAKRLGKTEFRAYQTSRRGGQVICRLTDHRIELEGSCVFYLEGEAEI